MADVQLPTTSEIVRRAILLEPLGGPKDTFYYLDAFPEEIYNKAPDSRLYKFIRSLVGEAGVNWLRKNHFEARIMLEELGIDMFDLDSFFGVPFAFGRIVEEELDVDPYGVLPKEQWEQVKAKNSRYRNRALDYMNGARAGNTPLGMRLVAKAGLGHDVEIIENYRYLFDIHTDDPLGLDYYGKTHSTEEMVVLPRREVGMSEQQMVALFGNPEWPTGGTLSFVYNGIPSVAWPYTIDNGDGPEILTTIPFDGTSAHVRLALEAIPQIGEGNVHVTGGPGPFNPWIITFQNKLANRDVPELIAVNNLTGPNPVGITVTTLQGGRESIDEVVDIPPKEAHNLQSAIDRIRPQTTIMTLGSARGLRERTNWREATSSSEYVEVTRFVTGNPAVQWPAPSNVYWIEANREKQAPREAGSNQYHYAGFHNVLSVDASTTLDPYSTASSILADYPEPLFVTSSAELTEGKGTSFVNRFYPQVYQTLRGVPPIRYQNGSWASQDWDIAGRTQADVLDEWVVIHFAFAKCVNYLSFDILRDDVQIDVDYDAHDGPTAPLWVPVTPFGPYSSLMTRNLDTIENTWASVGLTFTNRKQELIWTRALRIRLHRTDSTTGHWGYSIKMRNLRAARNIS